MEEESTMHHRFRIYCVTALIVSFFVLSATADIPKGEYAAIVAARYAEKEALLAESPYVRLRDDLFARYVRDRQVVPNERDVVVGPRWVIVQPKLDDLVAVKMGAMLARFLQEVMGLELAVVKEVPTDGATDGLILLKTQGGGQEGVSESFTVTVGPQRITVAGIDTPGLRDGVVRLIDLFGFRMAPFLEPQDITYTPRIAMRRSGSVPGYDKVVLLGSNSVGVGGGEVYAFSTSEAIPELAVRRVAGQMASLANAAKAATDAGLDAHAHFGIRTKFPKDDPVFQAHPEIRGALTWSADGEYNLCTEHPLVQQYFDETLEEIFRGAPDLQGIEVIIGGENFYHCFMRPYPHEKGHTNCARCEAIGPDIVVSNLVNNLARAARRANPNAVVEAWPYSAVSLWSADKYQSGLIKLLEPGTAILTESVKDMRIEKPFGIQKLLWDYSIDLIGPGERAMRQIELCNEQGIPTTVLSMYEMSFEAALLPEIPCMDRWAARADALAGSGADGAYLWKMGPYYGGFSSEVYKHFMWNPAPDQDELLSKLAARVAGFKAGSFMREAWRNVSEAIGWSPEIATYYKGPLYIGPAQPMIADKNAEVSELFDGYYLFLAEKKLSDGLKSHPTYFVDAPGREQVEAFCKSYDKMKDYLAQANAELDKAAPLVPEQNRILFESQAHPIRWLYHSVRTQSNFSRSCVIRDELIPLSQEKSLTAEKKARAAELYAEWRAVLLDELENTRAAAPIARADVRLDFYYRGDHMFNHLWDMVDAKAELLEKEIEEFLPSVAERCGVDTSEDRST
jgi:hypothetical protein